MLPIYVALFIIILVLFIVFIVKRKKATMAVPQNYETECWMLKADEKSVHAISKAADLDAQEKKLLNDLYTKALEAQNEYIYKDDVSFKVLFFKAYKTQLEQHASEEEKLALFTLRFKLEKAIDSALFDYATNNLAAGQLFSYKDAVGTNWELTLQKKTKKMLVLNIPEEFFTHIQKPGELSKIFLTFRTQKSAYTLQVLVDNYTKDAQGGYFLSVHPLNDFRPIQRRQSKRLAVRLPCSFSAIKKNGEKSKETEYTTYELSYSGELQDISATGCSMRCSIPLAQEQQLRLTFTLNGKDSYTAVGKIVMTQKSADGKEFILHIQFTDIELTVKNSIYSFIYEYNK